MQITPRLLFVQPNVSLKPGDTPLAGEFNIVDEGADTPLLVLIWIPSITAPETENTVQVVYPPQAESVSAPDQVSANETPQPPSDETPVREPEVQERESTLSMDEGLVAFPSPPVTEPVVKTGVSTASLPSGFVLVNAGSQQPEELSGSRAIRIPLAKIASIALKESSEGATNSVIITTTDGFGYPPFVLSDSPMGLIAKLESVMVLRRTSPHLYEAGAEPSEAPPQPATAVTESTDPVEQEGPRKQRRESEPESGSRTIHDLGFSILEQFSKLTRVFRDKKDTLMNPQLQERPRAQTLPGPNFKPVLQTSAANAQESDNNVSPDSTTPTSHAELTSVGSFELVPKIRPGRVPPPLPPKPRKPRIPPPQLPQTPPPHRGPPLDAATFAGMMDEEGRIRDPAALKSIVFYGGVEPSLRQEVWPFLLRIYPYTSTTVDRKKIRASNLLEYSQLKAEWMRINADDPKFNKFRERRHRIEKDVERTDRNHPFYKDDHSEAMVKLHNILLTYAFFNFELGYCQGMSDIISPILFVLQDEVNSFWAFARLMNKLESNFWRDQKGINSQLAMCRRLLNALDPELADYFDGDIDASKLFFCFRWILVQFKREFSFDDVQRVFEVFWTYFLTEDFHLFCCVALLKKYRAKFLDNRMKFDEILAFINDLALRIDLNEMFMDAETLVYQAQALGIATSLTHEDKAAPVPAEWNDDSD